MINFLKGPQEHVQVLSIASADNRKVPTQRKKIREAVFTFTFYEHKVICEQPKELAGS